MTRMQRGWLVVAFLAMGCNRWPTESPRPDAHFASDAAVVRVDAGPAVFDAGVIDRPDGGDAALPPMRAELESSLPSLTTAPTAPPALSGGTLLVTEDGARAVVADPERDRVVIVDLAARTVTSDIALSPGDEPGRAIEDAHGLVHVVLRRGGAVATIDPVLGTLAYRRAVCPIPRGIAYDRARDALYVACMGGELVTLPTTSAPAIRSVQVEDDLRDVVVDGATVFVSRFRSADVLVVDPSSGAIAQRIALPPSSPERVPAVAWRMTHLLTGGVVVVHQEAGPLRAPTTEPGAYGGGPSCGGEVMQGAVTYIRSAASVPDTQPMPCTVLPVDVATYLDPRGIESQLVAVPGVAPLQPELQLAALMGFGRPLTFPGFSASGRIVAVAVVNGQALVQTREPAQLVTWTDFAAEPIPLGGESRADTGFDLFHSNAGARVACASCHPEGGDDGHVWSFPDSGLRRTIPLRGGILGTEPFHWNGELADFDALAHDVFDVRMGGGSLSAPYTAALAHYVDQQPPLPTRASIDAAAAARGQALFESTDVGCADCHTGERLSNEATTDVGTGGGFQVPSLRGVSYRAPFMHDGCAATLRDRFGVCGGDAHGSTAGLTSAQVDDLTAYLTSL